MGSVTLEGVVLASKIGVAALNFIVTILGLL
jgi:hypothetical protein